MRKFAIIMAVAMALTVMTASVALADPPAEPTENAACFDGGDKGPAQGAGWKNHGTGHIVGEYIAGDGNASSQDGGENPAHSGSGVTPGVTFCNQHGQGWDNAATVGVDD